jgi:hypothetical protein
MTRFVEGRADPRTRSGPGGDERQESTFQTNLE